MEAWYLRNVKEHGGVLIEAGAKCYAFSTEEVEFDAPNKLHEFHGKKLDQKINPCYLRTLIQVLRGNVCLLDELHEHESMQIWNLCQLFELPKLTAYFRWRWTNDDPDCIAQLFPSSIRQIADICDVKIDQPSSFERQLSEHMWAFHPLFRRSITSCPAWQEYFEKEKQCLAPNITTNQTLLKVAQDTISRQLIKLFLKDSRPQPKANDDTNQYDKCVAYAQKFLPADSFGIFKRCIVQQWQKPNVYERIVMFNNASPFAEHDLLFLNIVKEFTNPYVTEPIDAKDLSTPTTTSKEPISTPKVSISDVKASLSTQKVSITDLKAPVEAVKENVTVNILPAVQANDPVSDSSANVVAGGTRIGSCLIL